MSSSVRVVKGQQCRLRVCDVCVCVCMCVCDFAWLVGWTNVRGFSAKATMDSVFYRLSFAHAKIEVNVVSIHAWAGIIFEEASKK